jgi:Fur family transcriptional regulator, ferric uptake regulator
MQNKNLRHKQASEILREFLKKGENRITSALEYDGHFGADDLYVIMKNNKSRVSRATVYKTLELLVQCNLLSKRNFGDNMTRYETSFKRQSHDHLICMDCGRIVEFTNSSLENIPKDLTQTLGFNFENYSFNIFARCKNIKTCKHYHNK